MKFESAIFHLSISSARHTPATKQARSPPAPGCIWGVAWRRVTRPHQPRFGALAKVWSGYVAPHTAPGIFHRVFRCAIDNLYSELK